MVETESDYPVPSHRDACYEESWRPEDKAMESAEAEVLSQYPDPPQESDDACDIESAAKDK